MGKKPAGLWEKLFGKKESKEKELNPPSLKQTQQTQADDDPNNLYENMDISPPPSSRSIAPVKQQQQRSPSKQPKKATVEKVLKPADPNNLYENMDVALAPPKPHANRLSNPPGKQLQHSSRKAKKGGKSPQNNPVRPVPAHSPALHHRSPNHKPTTPKKKSY